MDFKELIKKLTNEGTSVIETKDIHCQVLPYSLFGNESPTVFNIVIEGSIHLWVYTQHDLAHHLYGFGLIEKENIRYYLHYESSGKITDYAVAEMYKDKAEYLAEVRVWEYQKAWDYLYLCEHQNTIAMIDSDSLSCTIDEFIDKII